MKDSELLQRLNDPEDNWVERKLEGVKASDLRRTLVAFANSVDETTSAILFVGVGDRGEIVGCQNSDSKQKNIREICDRDCYPPIQFQSRALELDGKVVVAVVIRRSKDRPHFAGNAYVRKGSETVIASDKIFSELVHSRNDKLAEILRLKRKVITVISLRHKIGEARIISDNNYRERSECVVVDCDAHVVRMQVISSGKQVAEPVELIQLSFDEEKYRPMFIIRG